MLIINNHSHIAIKSKLINYEELKDRWFKIRFRYYEIIIINLYTN
jgi:hypothetical protein